MTDLQDFGFGTQIRKSPYFDATVKWGAKGFSVYNHMYIPRDFGSPEENFWNLINHAILCDVAVERQVQITGPDAAAFVQYLTPRDLSKLAVGQCKYNFKTPSRIFNFFKDILIDPAWLGRLLYGINDSWLWQFGGTSLKPIPHIKDTPIRSFIFVTEINNILN